MLKRTLRLAATIAMVPTMASAQGLVSVGAIPNAGGGLGAVLTVLTLNNTNNVSSGCISPPDSPTCGGDYANNTVQESSQIRLISELGTGSGDLGTNLRLIANFSEPNSNRAQLENLTLYLYNAAGAQVSEISLVPAFVAFESTNPGVGNAGFGFALDAAGIAAFNNALIGANAAVSIGLGAEFSDVQGGLETFSIARVNSTTSVVPEPSTYALMAAGLAGIFVARRRRNRA